MLQLPERINEWKSPTGRYLRPNHTFRVPGEGPQAGRFRFIAFVNHPEYPYIEAVEYSPTKEPGAIRCIRPDNVHEISTKPVEVR